MPFNSWGIAGQPIGGQIQRSRFYQPDMQETLARQMLAEGTSTAPVQHWTQGLARLLQGYMGGQIANRAAQEREQRQQGQQQTLAQALAAMQGRPGGIETTPGGTSIDWQSQPGSAKNAAAILAQNPDLAGMGFQLQMSEAEREQARQQRMADMAEERAYKKGETADERAWREKMQGQQFAQQKALLNMKGPSVPTGYEVAPGGGLRPIQGGPADPATIEAMFKAKEKPRSLPTPVMKDVLENRQNLNVAENALKAIQGKDIGDNVKGDPTATGWKGYLPDAALQRMDPGGTATRAAIANIGSMVIKDRSGAAVSAAEFPRLRPFIPAITDDPETVKTKLENFTRVYRQLVDDNEAFYRESGYSFPEYGGSGGSALAPAGGGQDAQALEWAKSNPDDPRAAEIMRRLGGR